MFFLVTLIAAFILMLGKYSPVYLAYSVWPLNLFRVPSRFAWIFLITIVSASAWFLTRMTGRIGRWNGLFSVMVSIVLAIHGVQLMGAFWDYHAFGQARLWLTAPPLIKKYKRRRAPSARSAWNLSITNNFSKPAGARQTTPTNFSPMCHPPNGNLYWNIVQTDIYAGRFLKRSSLVESLMGSEIKSSESVATISATAKRILDLYHGANIVSALPLDIKSFFRY